MGRSATAPVGRYALLATVVLAAVTADAADARNECANPVESCDSQTDYFPDKYTAQYDVDDVQWSFNNTFIQLEVYIENAEDAQRFRLIRCGCEEVVPAAAADTIDISIPVTKVYVAQGPTAYFFEILDALDVVSSTGSGTFIYSDQIQTRIADGRLYSLPEDADVSNPDTFSGPQGAADVALVGPFDPEVSITSLPIVEQQANVPLGRSEWIKLIGYLVGKEKQAANEFSDIEARYIEARRLANSVRRQPSVVVNSWSEFSGWQHLRAGSYPYALLQDANAAYRLVDFDDAIGLTIEETAVLYSSADYWLNVGFSPSLPFEDFLAPFNESASVLREFESVKCNRVYSYGGRFRENGTPSAALDYFESGIVRPDLVLRDMVSILHPSLELDNELFYYFNANTSQAVCPVPDLPGGRGPEDGTVHVTAVLRFNTGRFEVEDLLEDTIKPAVLRATGLASASVFWAFDQSADAENDTAILEALFVIDDEKDAVETAIELMNRNLVSEVNRDLAARAEERGDGGGSVSVTLVEIIGPEKRGLSGDQIWGIVIGVLLVGVAVVALVLVVVSGRRRSSAAGGFTAGQEEEVAAAASLEKNLAA